MYHIGQVRASANIDFFLEILYIAVRLILCMVERRDEQQIGLEVGQPHMAAVSNLLSEQALRFIRGMEQGPSDYRDALVSIETLVKMVNARVSPYVKIAGETGLQVREVLDVGESMKSRDTRSFGVELDAQFNNDTLRCVRELVEPFLISVERKVDEWGSCFGKAFVVDLLNGCRRFVDDVGRPTDDVRDFFRKFLTFRKFVREKLKTGAFRGEMIEMDVSPVDVDVLVGDGADLHVDLKRKAGVILRTLSTGPLGVVRLRKRIPDVDKIDDLFTVLRLMNQLFSESKTFDRRKFDAIAALEQCFGEIYGYLYKSGELESIEGRAITTMFDAYVRGLARYKNEQLQDVDRQKLVDDLHRIIGRMRGFDASLSSLSRRSPEVGDEQAEVTVGALRGALMEFGTLEDIMCHFPMRDLRALKEAFLSLSAAWSDGDVEGFRRAINPLRSCIDALDMDFAELMRQGYFPQPSFMKKAEVPEGGYEEW